MKRLSHTILRLMLVFIPVMLALAHHAKAQPGADTVYAGQSTVYVIEEFAGDTYYWELYNDVTGINFATDPGNCPPAEAYFAGGVNTGDSVEIMWLVPGTYFFKVTATGSCSNNLKVGKMVVIESESYAVFLDPGGICPGDTAVLTIEITGCPGPWDVTYTDGTDSWTIEDIGSSPYSFQLIPSPTAPGDYPYWITSISNSCGLTNNTPSDPVILTVHPIPVTSPIYRYEP